MIDAARLLPKLLSKTGDHPEVAEIAAKIAWSRAAGAGLRQHAVPFRLNGKTLIVAEKPSVARDIANALPGPFQSPSDGYMESDDYVVTFAVGHLVQLKDPEAYDERFKKWRMDDLPIVPEKFELEPRDAKSKKQLTTIHKLMKRLLRHLPRQRCRSTKKTNMPGRRRWSAKLRANTMWIYHMLREQAWVEELRSRTFWRLLSRVLERRASRRSSRKHRVPRPSSAWAGKFRRRLLLLSVPLPPQFPATSFR